MTTPESGRCKCGHYEHHHTKELRFCAMFGCTCERYEEQPAIVVVTIPLSSRVQLWHEKQKAFMEAAYALNTAWECGNLPGEFGSEQYPFAHSFDEVCARIHDWVEHYSEASCETTT